MKYTLGEVRSEYDGIVYTFSRIERNYSWLARLLSKKIRPVDNQTLLECVERLTFLIEQESVQQELTRDDNNKLEDRLYSQMDRLRTNLRLYITRFSNGTLDTSQLS